MGSCRGERPGTCRGSCDGVQRQDPGWFEGCFRRGHQGCSCSVCQTHQEEGRVCVALSAKLMLQMSKVNVNGLFHFWVLLARNNSEKTCLKNVCEAKFHKTSPSGTMD